MLDFVAILSAAQETARLANEARPDAPLRPDPIAPGPTAASWRGNASA